jgi:hypothetical protein
MKQNNECCGLVIDLERMMFRSSVLATNNDIQSYRLVKTIRRALDIHGSNQCDRGIKKSTQEMPEVAR